MAYAKMINQKGLCSVSFQPISADADLLSNVAVSLPSSPSRFKLHAPSWDLETTASKAILVQEALSQAKILSSYGIGLSEIAEDLAADYPDLLVTQVRLVSVGKCTTMWVDMGEA